MLQQKKIAVIGLGYVGLPLAMKFAKHFPVAGFDIKESRIQELKAGIDNTHEANIKELQKVSAETKTWSAKKGFFLTNKLDGLKDTNTVIFDAKACLDRIL